MIRFDVPDDETRQLAETAQRFVADHYSLAKRAAMVQEPAGERPAHWSLLADLGWLAAPLPERVGGLGMTPAQLVPFLATLGAGLVLEPYTPVVLHCAATLARALPEDKAAHLLAPMLDGGQMPVLLMPAAESVQAVMHPDGAVRLSAEVALIPGATKAAAFFAAVEIDGETFLLAVDPADVEVSPYRLIDDQPAARIRLKDARAEILASGNTVTDALGWGRDVTTVGVMAEMSGLIAALMRATREHVATRMQFGQPISKFQAVQHRMADVFIASEEAHSMAMLAAEAMELPQDAARARLVSAAKVKLASASRTAARDAVQLHGGMGMTDALDIGHMVKRLLVLEQLGGSQAAHLARFARRA